MGVLVTAYPVALRTHHFVPVTLSGGEAAIIADVSAQVGLSLEPLSTATIATAIDRGRKSGSSDHADLCGSRLRDGHDG